MCQLPLQRRNAWKLEWCPWNNCLHVNNPMQRTVVASVFRTLNLPKSHLLYARISQPSLVVCISESGLRIPIVVNPYSTVVTAFFLNPQFNGLYGSSGPSKSTMTSSDVLLCDKGCVKRAVCPGSRLRILDITDCARCSSTDSPEAAVVCFSSAELLGSRWPWSKPFCSL